MQYFYFLRFLIFASFLEKIFSMAENYPSKRRLKILVYSPIMGFSHSQFLGKIADTLQGAGHDVHFVKFAVNLGTVHGRNETKLVKNIYSLEPKAMNAEKFDVSKMDFHKEAFLGHQQPINFMKHPMKDFIPMAKMICAEIIQNRELLEKLAEKKFDVGIAEMYDLCPMAFLHRIGVRTKLAAYAVSLYPLMGRHFGIPTFPSFVPNMLGNNHESLKSSFYARLVNFFNEMYDWAWMDEATLRAEEPLIRAEFGPNFPKMREIGKNVSLAFFNTNPFFEMPRPISNKIIYIGGLVDRNGHSEENLDERSKRILDNAKEGAVLFTFGSTVETRGMRPEMRRAILRALARFPSIQFLWKLDNASRDADSELFSSTPNVHIFEWIRQSAVLKHPNLRLFISHCGQNSVTEASRAGIPVLAIPLLGDQLYNSAKAKHLGMGIYLDVRELNGPNAEEVMFKAVEKILNNQKYGEKAKEIQKKVTRTPFSPSEKLIRWVEFAAEFGNLNELNMPGDEEMNWFIYYSLDAITFTLAILMGLIWIGWKCAKLLMALILARNFPSRRKMTKLKGQ